MWKILLSVCVISLASVCHGQIKISGTVTDIKGKPIDGVAVMVDFEKWNGEGELIETKTDRNGKYTLNVNKKKLRHVDGSKCEVFFYHKDYEIRSDYIPRAFQGNDFVSAKLIKCEKQTVKVVDNSGKPVPGALVSFASASFPGSIRVTPLQLPFRIIDKLEVKTNHNGIAKIIGIGERDMTIRVKQKAVVFLRVKKGVAKLPESGNLTLVLGPTKEKYKVKFGKSFSDGYGAMIVKELSEGTNTIKDIPAGFYSTTVLHPQKSKSIPLLRTNYMAEKLKIRYKVPVVEGVRFKARLVGGKSGKPLGNAVVNILQGKRSISHSFHTVTDADGNISIWVPPGIVIIKVLTDLSQPIFPYTSKAMNVPASGFDAGPINVPRN